MGKPIRKTIAISEETNRRLKSIAALEGSTRDKVLNRVITEYGKGKAGTPPAKAESVIYQVVVDDVAWNQAKQRAEIEGRTLRSAIRSAADEYVSQN